MNGELYPGEFEAMEHNGRMDALEQEPCSDLISKEDTLKAMSNTWSHICYVARRKKPTKGEEAVYSDMVGTVKNLPPATAEPCEDAISREPFTDSTICEGISCNECSFNRKDKGGCILEERVMRLPSIQPQPKTGYWILTSDDDCEYCTCSECGYQNGENWMIGSQIKFCQECGAKMIEPQESEG